MWIIEETEGVVYDKFAHMLKTEDGHKIASVYIGKGGNLEMSLMMDTNFLSDEGWGAVGFDGCENHVSTFVWLREGGGVLEYQEDRHSIFRDPGKKISIRIMMLKGDVVASSYEKVAKNSRFRTLPQNVKIYLRHC